VRFPLDYYRILGVPSQSTPDQVEQAFQDRLQQRPHHQHSSVAINGRQQLLEKAFATLSKPTLRQAYDNNFFDGAGAPGSIGLSAAMAKAATSLGGRPAATLPKLETGIEIEDHQFAGALLILHELGEYDKVVELGTPEIARSTEPKSPHVSLALSQSDVCLSVALSHLELGREAWQQGHYEAAATDLQTGLDLLMNEGLFAVVQNQIRTDLARLRPYRILELLAAPLEDTTTRRQGLVMLRAMLQERNGIDGNGDDQSGLNIEDCLKFVQQLRSYLTVREQQDLFEYEAQRPSAVGLYLAVYALIARGFAERQPALLKKAEQMLQQLCGYKDVHLELASCNLLLGETDLALDSLEQSQDQEMLEFIQNYYSETDNLIPGLYYYTEYWLREEVLPYFRDLADQPVLLKAYFDDEQVQRLIELLSQSSGTGTNQQLANMVAPSGYMASPPTSGNDWSSYSSSTLPPTVTEDPRLGATFGYDPIPAQGFETDNSSYNSPTGHGAMGYDTYGTGGYAAPDYGYGTADYGVGSEINGRAPTHPSWRLPEVSQTPLLPVSPPPGMPPVTSGSGAGGHVQGISTNPRSTRPRAARPQSKPGQRQSPAAATATSAPMATATGRSTPRYARARQAPAFRLGRKQWLGLGLLVGLAVGGTGILAKSLGLFNAKEPSSPLPVSRVPGASPSVATLPTTGTTGNPSLRPSPTGAPLASGNPSSLTSPQVNPSLSPGVTIGPNGQPITATLPGGSSPQSNVGTSPGTSPGTNPGTSPGTSSGNPAVRPNSANPNSTLPNGNPGPANSPGASPNVAAAVTAPGPLTTVAADQVIRNWQRAKAQAMGKQYNSQGLQDVLTGAALVAWRESSQGNRSDRTHWEYQLQNLLIESVLPTANPNETVVIAKISEAGNFFENNQNTPTGPSYPLDTYRVRYTLTLKNGRWLISNMKKL
jgi:hypothetical protein